MTTVAALVFAIAAAMAALSTATTLKRLVPRIAELTRDLNALDHCSATIVCRSITRAPLENPLPVSHELSPRRGAAVASIRPVNELPAKAA